MEKKKIWITWEKQRRNRTLSQELGAELFEIVVKKGRILRYIFSVFQSLKIVNKERPDILFVQNPSLVLTLISILFCPLFKYKLVVDEHNSGLFPLEGTSPFFNSVARFAVRKADHVIVTNATLATLAASWGGRPLILPDPLPIQDFKTQPFSFPSDIFDVFFICTWSKDEPYLEVLKAAEALGGDYRISISGNWKGKIDECGIPENVDLTGFLSDEDYVAKLQGASAVMVLTTRDHCLNCGAYEAVAAEKPLILSNKMEIRKYFSRGVVYAENDAASISRSLKEVRENLVTLKGGISLLKSQLTYQWATQRQAAATAIDC